MMRRVGRLLAAAVAALALLPATAGAHARLEAVSPAAGALVATTPQAVTFRFDEAVTAPDDAIRVLDGAGAAVRTGPTTHPGGAGAELAARLPARLPPGTYTATSRVISADGHPVSVGSTFSVGRRGPVAAAAAAALGDHAEGGGAVRTLDAAARALTYGAIAVALGALGLLLAAWRPATAGTPAARALDRPVRLGVLAAAGAGVVGALAQLGLEAAEAQVGLGEVLGTRFGTTWLLAVAAFAVLGGLSRLPARRAGGALAAPAAAVLVAAPAVSGHGATQAPVWLMLPSTLVHVAAMSLWVGGLAALVLLVPPALRRVEPAARSRAALGTLRRFSPLALACVVALLATGIVQSLVVVRAPGHLLDSAIGRAVLVKLVVVAGLVRLGARNRRALRADPPRARPLARAVRAEVALAVVALGATGALAGSAPAGTADASAAPAAPPAAGPTTALRTLGGQRVRIAVGPGRAGTNAVVVDLSDPTTGRPAHAEEVALAARLPRRGLGPLEAEARRAPGRPGRWRASLPLAVTGTWQLDVTVRTSAFDEATTRVAVPVG